MSGSTTQSNQISTAYSFKLVSLNYVASNGQGLDLRPVMVELNIFMDLFATVMSGNLVIEDATNIFAYFPSVGNEFLIISLDKPGLNAPLNKTFRIYSKSKTNIQRQTKQNIRIDFCSEEMLISKTSTFSKTYSGMLISDMVNDITNTHFNAAPATMEPTTGIQTLTIPHYTPMQALNWLASKATSSYVGASYMFYENGNGFAFQSMQKLMDVSQPTRIYNYNTKNVSMQQIMDMYDVATYHVIDTPNTLDSLINGRNSGILLTFDPLRLKYSEGALNADDLFASSIKLGGEKPYNNYQNSLNKTMADAYASYRKFYPTNAGQNNSQEAPYIAQRTNYTSMDTHRWLMQRNAQMMQMLNVRLKLVVPGDVRMNVGDVIQFNMPSIESQTGSTQGSLQRKLDPFYTGLFMITAIRHRVTVPRFETVLEICKDSFNTQLPQATFTDISGGIIP